MKLDITVIDGSCGHSCRHDSWPAADEGVLVGVEPGGDGLEALQAVLAVRSVDLVQVRPQTLHLSEHPDGQLTRTLQLHDVHLGPNQR